MNTPKTPPRPPTLTEQINAMQGKLDIAISRTEIALVAADRSEAASLRTEASVRELMRVEPDAEGKPGPLYWIANELIRIRRDVHPVTRAKVYAMCVIIALLSGAAGSGLLTCVSQGKILP